MVTQSWLMYDLTGREWSLGVLGLVLAVPTISLSLFGGAAADRLNQRWLIMGSQATSALLVGALATLVFAGAVQMWHVLVIAFLGGAVQTFDGPARMALYPHLIDRKDLMNAVALNNVVWQGTRLVGPVLAGFLIAAGGMALPLYITAACFLAMAVAIKLIRAPRTTGAQGRNVLANIAEGVGFVRSNSLFSSLIGLSYLNGFFGLSYILLLPIFAKDILEVGAQGLGIMNGVSGVGALVAIGFLTFRGDIQHKAVPLLGGAILFGVSLMLFAVSSSYYLSLLVLFLGGGAVAIHMMTIQTVIQARVPDRLRGRVMGIYSLTYSMAALGAFPAGFLAALLSVRFAVGFGGFVLAVCTLLIAVSQPSIRSLGPEPVPEAG